MLKRLNHIAIAVPDLEAAVALYRDRLGAGVSEVQHLPGHGVSVVFVELDNTRIELLHPLGEDSPIRRFLERNPAGGIHHLCCEVDQVDQAGRSLQEAGIRVLGDGEPAIGAHGLPVLFLHPRDMLGTLVELEQAESPRTPEGSA